MFCLAFPNSLLLTSKINQFPINCNPIYLSCTKPVATSPSKRNVILPRSCKVITHSKSHYEVVEKGEEETDNEMEQVEQPHMPKHVAIFTDGHRRWAKAKGLSKEEGYRVFTKSVIEYAVVCYKMKIQVLTVFTIATAQFTTRKEDVEGIFMDMFVEGEKSYFDMCIRLGIRISIMGNRSMLPEKVQELINKVEEDTKENSRLHLILAIDYNGKSDIIQACKSVANMVNNSVIEAEDINESLFEKQLQTNCCMFPNPDLLIRTGGKIKLSNFLLWQIAYTELYFTEKLSPDFDGQDFMEALSSYQKRKRRYGGSSY